MVGLGDQFLKHLSRCSLLLHVVSAYEAEADYDVIAAIQKISKEVKLSSQDIGDKVRWIILTKVDLVTKEDLAELEARIKAYNADFNCMAISSVNKQGLAKLAELVWQELNPQEF